MCRIGNECPYGHDMSLSNKGTLACKYYATGTCAYGDKCRFSHGEPAKPAAPPVAQAMGLNPNAKAWSPPQPTSTAVSKDWAQCKEFVPKKQAAEDENAKTEEAKPEDENPKATPNKTWAQVVNIEGQAEITIEEAQSQLCPFSIMDVCRYGENCAYTHGLMCDMCDQPILHPDHEAQRNHHKKVCMRQHEAEMEQAFAVAKSKDKTCGICMEVIVEKSPKTEARFGIMPNCNHCFCLACLRKWRQAKTFENKIIRYLITRNLKLF